MGLLDFLQKIKSTPSKLPTLIPIKAANTDQEKDLNIEIRDFQNYFTIRINEMFLENGTSWLSSYEPMVYSHCEFKYAGKDIEHPFVVGKNLFEGKKEPLPQGMIYRNTDITGTYPYAGGKLALSVILCKSKTGSYVVNALNFIEKVSGLFSENISTMVNNFSKAARVVAEGIDQLTDSNDIDPVIGFRQEFNPNAGDKFMPGYYALLEQKIPESDYKRFFVREKQLVVGDNINDAQSYKAGNYVLVSINQDLARNDYRSLPFYSQYTDIEKMLAERESLGDEEVKRIRGKLMGLKVAVKQSPDLTEPHGRDIIEKLFKDVAELKETKLPMGQEGPGREKDFWDEMEDKILAL